MKEKININGVITLGSRMKRLSDLLFLQAQEVYDSHSENFKASWFSILATIKTEENIDFKTLANRHNVSSSAISQTMKELEKNSFVKIETGNDKRSRIITLTQKGKEAVEKLQPILSKIQEVLSEIIGNDAGPLIESLETIESKLRQKTLAERVEIKIINYNNEYKKQFEELNLSWLKKHFEITNLDKEMLNNPEKFTKEMGGEIFLAMKNKEIVGSLALIPHQDKEAIEISKMAVSEDVRREGIAKLLLEQAINFAREKSFTNLFALTSSKLGPAMQFYRKNNFEESNFSDTRYSEDRVDRKFSMSLGN